MGTRLNAWPPTLLATTLVALLAVVAAGAAGVDTAHAQQVDDSLPPLADLTISSEYGRGTVIWPAWAVTVKNETVGAHPGMHIRLVKVRFNISDSVRGNTTRIWTIRDLPPGGSLRGGPQSLRTEPAVTDGPEKVPQRFYAEIIESDPVELPRFRFNNTTEHWAIENRREVRVGSNNIAGVNRYTNGDIAIDVAGISDRLPRQGGATTFTMAARIDPKKITRGGIDVADSHRDDTLFDVEVEISLSPGLSFAANQPEAPSGTTLDTTTGIWNMGTFLRSSGSTLLPVAVNLTADSLADLPLEERCLTAKVVKAVPWFANDPLKRQNDTATACLGKELLSSGAMDLIDYYPCISDTSTPCTSTGTLELVAARRVGGQFEYRQPETVIVHVPDPGGRFSKNGSLVWSTVNLMDMRNTWTRLTSSWSVKQSVRVTAPGGGDAPGRWLLTDTDDSANSFDLLDAMDSSTVTFGFFDLSDAGNDPALYYLEAKVDFWALGTYKALLGIYGRLSGTTYTDSGTYIFHVGPVADLAVRDAGANMEVPAGQRAFSIVAVNNGPDDAPAVRVKITGLKADEVQHHSATRGSFDPDSGVWTIGDLRTKEYFRRVSDRDGEVLTIIPDRSADKEIGVSIRNTQDYQVCIDSSRENVELSSPSQTACKAEDSSNTWHTTNYYDHLENNNSATVSQHEGTGDLLPTLQVSGLGGAAMLARWTELPSLYRRTIEGYEIERSTDGGKSWTALPGPIIRPVYVDIEARPGDNPTYRVRAVNDFNHKGPWSSSLGPTGKSSTPQGAVEAPGAPLNVGATVDGETAIDVFWDAPTDEGGAPITQYEVQWSADGRTQWRTAGYVNNPQNRTYKHTGLSSGTTRHYRVAARNSGGRGTWSDPPAFATTLAGVADRPVMTVKSTTPNTIRVRWTEPRDNGGDITSYEIEWSADGSAESWQSLATVGVSDEGFDKREYSDTSVPAGDRRYYRARAINEAGNGRWSDAVSGVTPPGMPTVFRVEPNGPNAILITWSPPDDATDGSTVTSYELEVSTDGGNNYSRLSTPGRSARSYNHTGLRPGDTRHYQIRACNSAGCGDWSFPDSATVVPGVPYAPGLAARANSASEIKLSWTKPNDGGSEITGYELEHYTDSNGDWSALDNRIPPDKTEYAHQDANGDLFGGGTTHRYRVRAVNDMGEGAWSAERSVTISAQAPGKTELTVSGVQAGTQDYYVNGVIEKRPVYREDSLELSWTVPEDNGSRITGYRVERNDRVGGYDNWVRIGTAGASATSYTDRNLYSGTYYCYRVAANSSAGTGPFSNEVCESTAGQGPRHPDAPITRLSAVSSNRVTITWDPPENDGGRPVTNYVYEKITPFADEFEYNCEYHPNDRENWTDACKLVSAGTRSATFSNLEPGASYKFRVRAVTSYSHGDWATVSAHLPAARDDSETDSITEDLQVKVSSASLTVSEGRGQASYRVTLNKAPKEGETIRLDWYLDIWSAAVVIDYDGEGNCYNFGDFTRENWNRGCTLTLSAEEDENSDNEIGIMEHSISVGGREVSGPSVRVEVRDND